MAHRIGDRIEDVTNGSTVSTGNFTVSGSPPTGKKTVSAYATVNADTIDLVLEHQTLDQWEVTRCTRVSANEYSRATTAANGFQSSSTGSPVDFSAGVLNVFSDISAFFAKHFNTVEISIASVAGTTDIGALNGKFVEITGTNTITGFGSAPHQERWVRYAAATPHTHHATTFICPGGASFTSAAGDTAIWKSDASGNWRCYHYQRASVATLRDDISAFGVKRVQTFTGSGTYTPHADMLYCIIEAVGGGGGGGGSAGGSGDVFAAAGGGSGAYSRKLATAADIGASKAVTIGAGGAGGTAGANNGSAGGESSVGTLCIAKGGAGGSFSSSSASILNGGAGGVITGGAGDIIAAGAPGGCGHFNSADLTHYSSSGHGGSSYFGGGAAGVQVATAGANASSYGSGGSGAHTFNEAANRAGGNGSAGFVIVTEFCSK